MSDLPRKKYPPMIVDRKGGLELSAEFVRDNKIKTGDEYAVWEKGDDFILVFKKEGRWKSPIPKHAHRGRVEPALPEIVAAPPKPAQSAKPKTSRAKKLDEMI